MLLPLFVVVIFFLFLRVENTLFKSLTLTEKEHSPISKFRFFHRSLDKKAILNPGTDTETDLTPSCIINPIHGGFAILK